MDVLSLHDGGATAAKPRLAGFDLIRALAALGVVLLHSCAPYLRHPMPGLVWPVRDGSSDVVDFGFWWIEVFIMPLFLVLAGFLAWQTLSRRGAAQTVRHRAKRLLVPLLFGIVVVLPLSGHCFVLGWVTDGLVEPAKLRSFKFSDDIEKDFWGLAHLWFLLYLFLYIVVLALWSVIRDRWNRLSQLSVSPKNFVAMIVVAGSIVLWFRPEVVWGFQHATLPVPSKWIYSGLFFVMGVVLAVHDGQLHWLRRQVNRLWLPAACVSVATVMLGRWHLAGGDSQLAEITLAILTCLCATLVTFSIVGWAVKRTEPVRIAISYLAAASLWVYLIHHPIVGLVHIDLKVMLPGASPIWKTLISFTAASAYSLLLYEGVVRKTALGRWLGIAWEPLRQSPIGESPIRDRHVIALDPSDSDREAAAARRAA